MSDIKKHFFKCKRGGFVQFEGVMKNCEANCCKSPSPSLICSIIASVTLAT